MRLSNAKGRQSVLNAAAWLIYHMRSADHITDTLASLHWLCVLEWIEYKVAVLMYKVLHGTALVVLGSTRSCCRSVRSTDIMLCWPPIVCWCHLSDFHQSLTNHWAFTVARPRVWNTDGGHNNIPVTPSLLSTPQSMALQKVIPGHHHLNLLLLFNLEVALLLSNCAITDDITTSSSPSIRCS